MYTICTYTASVLVEGTKNMIIVWMVLAVTGLIALVYNLKQLSCNMVQAHWFKIQWFVPYYVSNFTFFKLYLNTLKKPWTDSGIKGRCIWIDFSKLSLVTSTTTLSRVCKTSWIVLSLNTNVNTLACLNYADIEHWFTIVDFWCTNIWIVN